MTQCYDCGTLRQPPFPRQWVCQNCRTVNWDGGIEGINKVLAVDFDGVVHRYSQGWQNGEIYDPPVPGAIEGMMSLQHNGFLLIVFTARSRSSLGRVDTWLKQEWESVGRCMICMDSEVENRTHPIPEVTNRKPGARAYIDDHAFKFETWQEVLNEFKESKM